MDFFGGGIVIFVFLMYNVRKSKSDRRKTTARRLTLKKTKIICTLGPASCTKETISAMADAGMNVARLNFSHGTYEGHAAMMDLIKEVRKAKRIPLPILLDTKGPEFRIGTFADGRVELSAGDEFSFTTENIVGDNTCVSVSYAGLCDEMAAGDRILLNNGLMVFEVTSVEPPYIRCKVLTDGAISDRKSMFFPEKELKSIFLSEHDKSDLLFGIKHGVDFVALSFVSKAQDVIDAKNFLEENGGENIDEIGRAHV